MAITIDIDTARPYQVHVGTFLLEQAGPLVRATAGGTKAVIVTDTNVGPLYQMPVKQSLEASGYEVSICTFEAGEAHKRAETYVAILEFVAEHELSRSDVIVALGGGVVGDVAGFVAATYMRGCKFVQIPTSLLAMVDSSVGGKTAIDLAAGKNLAGAFWQPSVVIADVGCLATLTPEQFADGCGEVIKHAVIADPELFAELEKTPLTLELLNRDVARVALIIARNIDIKRAVVVADERETNQRKLLNFGHSAGHAEHHTAIQDQLVPDSLVIKLVLCPQIRRTVQVRQFLRKAQGHAKKLCHIRWDCRRHRKSAGNTGNKRCHRRLAGTNENQFRGGFLNTLLGNSGTDRPHINDGLQIDTVACKSLCKKFAAVDLYAGYLDCIGNDRFQCYGGRFVFSLFHNSYSFLSIKLVILRYFPMR